MPRRSEGRRRGIIGPRQELARELLEVVGLPLIEGHRGQAVLGGRGNPARTRVARFAEPARGGVPLPAVERDHARAPDDRWHRRPGRARLSAPTRPSWAACSRACANALRHARAADVRRRRRRASRPTRFSSAERIGRAARIEREDRAVEPGDLGLLGARVLADHSIEHAPARCARSPALAASSAASSSASPARGSAGASLGERGPAVPRRVEPPAPELGPAERECRPRAPPAASGNPRRSGNTTPPPGPSCAPSTPTRRRAAAPPRARRRRAAGEQGQGRRCACAYSRASKSIWASRSSACCTMAGAACAGRADELEAVARFADIAALPRELAAQEQHPGTRLRIERPRQEIGVERLRVLDLALVRRPAAQAQQRGQHQRARLARRLELLGLLARRRVSHSGRGAPARDPPAPTAPRPTAGRRTAARDRPSPRPRAGRRRGSTTRGSAAHVSVSG